MEPKELPTFSESSNTVAHVRRRASVVNVGDVPMGGNHPIRVQSMTTVDTMDTKNLLEQAIRLIEVGSEYVRITAPSIRDAQNLEVIRNELHRRGYKTPLIADIHFTPKAAEWAARVVEKVRINPGNYVDRKRFEQIEYTEADYQGELHRIRDRFLPLVRICKQYGTAMRIGTNHGSLSDRIMSRYGDTPLGMVESALEFVRICEDEQYYDVVLSMKASNPQVMVQAYRLLAKKLYEEGLRPYPLHLGVTEAGDGDEGRVKSSAGIGTLLEEGLGDTIRVSLTEEPEVEIPVANMLVNRRNNVNNLHEQHQLHVHTNPILEYHRRPTRPTLNFGGRQPPCVMADFSKEETIQPADLSNAGYLYVDALDKWNVTDTACDYLYAGQCNIDFSPPEALGIIYDYTTWQQHRGKQNSYPFFTSSEYLEATRRSNELNFVEVSLHDLSKAFIRKIKTDTTVILCANAHNEPALIEQRKFFATLGAAGCSAPVLIRGIYKTITSWEKAQLYAATDLGGLFIDGFGDGISITAADCIDKKQVNEGAFKILQAVRMRSFEAEYISCPSCGRTLFSLQETTAKIKAKTNHLKGVKIGIMGCIVNGPGEMADADYGYVGSGKEKITLYRGKEVVKRNVPANKAVEELVALIKEDGNWVDDKPK